MSVNPTLPYSDALEWKAVHDRLDMLERSVAKQSIWKGRAASIPVDFSTPPTVEVPVWPGSGATEFACFDARFVVYPAAQAPPQITVAMGFERTGTSGATPAILTVTQYIDGFLAVDLGSIDVPASGFGLKFTGGSLALDLPDSLDSLGAECVIRFTVTNESLVTGWNASKPTVRHLVEAVDGPATGLSVS